MVWKTLGSLWFDHSYIVLFFELNAATVVEPFFIFIGTISSILDQVAFQKAPKSGGVVLYATFFSQVSSRTVMRGVERCQKPVARCKWKELWQMRMRASSSLRALGAAAHTKRVISGA